MAAFVDDFDGTAGQWLKDRSGWAPLFGYYDAFQIDGAGNLQLVARSNDGKSLMHEVSAASQYAEVVIGPGFLAGNREVEIAVAAKDSSNYISVAYNAASSELGCYLNGSTILNSYSGAIAAGDTINLAYTNAGNLFEVRRNGTLIMSGDVASWSSNFVGATKTGIFVSYSSSAARADVLRSFKSDVYSGPPDTTPPTLTSATGTATGDTTASGTVTTDEANGTLYYVASTNATEVAATVKASQSKAVTATGAQSVAFTGLTAGTTYRIHYLHRDAAGNDSTVLSSSPFTTTVPDIIPPTLTAPTATATGSTSATGSVSTNKPSGTLYTLASTNATEAVATVKASGATTAVSVTGVQGVSVSGLTANTTYYLHFVHRDSAGNDSTRVSSAAFTTQAAAGTPTLTFTQLRNNTGTLLANESGATVHVYEVATGNKIATLAGRTSDAAGTLLAQHASMTAGTEYRAVIVLASGAEGLQKAMATT